MRGTHSHANQLHGRLWPTHVKSTIHCGHRINYCLYKPILASTVCLGSKLPQEALPADWARFAAITAIKVAGHCDSPDPGRNLSVVSFNIAHSSSHWKVQNPKLFSAFPRSKIPYRSHFGRRRNPSLEADIADGFYVLVQLAAPRFYCPCFHRIETFSFSVAPFFDRFWDILLVCSPLLSINWFPLVKIKFGTFFFLQHKKGKRNPARDNNTTGSRKFFPIKQGEEEPTQSLGHGKPLL